MGERWGLRGEHWTAVRPMRDEQAARGWAAFFVGTKKIRDREPYVDLYVDHGNGWAQLERFEGGMVAEIDHG